MAAILRLAMEGQKVILKMHMIIYYTKLLERQC